MKKTIRVAASALAPSALAVCLAVSTAARAQQHTTPDWMKVDAAKKTVTLSMIAGFDPNNGALNFNGYYNADANVVIPVGWNVKVDFQNHDGMLPHSLLVTQRYAKDKIPPQAGVNQVAINKAYTNDPESGLPPGAKDNFDFRSAAPGDYWMFCGVPGHGLQGMYVDLTIDPKAEAPYVVVQPGAEKGRP